MTKRPIDTAGQPLLDIASYARPGPAVPPAAYRANLFMRIRHGDGRRAIAILENSHLASGTKLTGGSQTASLLLSAYACADAAILHLPAGMQQPFLRVQFAVAVFAPIIGRSFGARHKSARSNHSALRFSQKAVARSWSKRIKN
jgi:hypothetical protein